MVRPWVAVPFERSISWVFTETMFGVLTQIASRVYTEIRKQSNVCVCVCVCPPTCYWIHQLELFSSGNRWSESCAFQAFQAFRSTFSEVGTSKLRNKMVK